MIAALLRAFPELVAVLADMLRSAPLGHDLDLVMTQAELDRTYPSTYASDSPRIVAVPNLPAEPGRNP
ncbi:MAG TPA: hypothetical protein VGG84_15225 [Gemmatimonadaceae bacterium]